MTEAIVEGVGLVGRYQRLTSAHPRGASAVRVALSILLVVMVVWLVLVPQFVEARGDFGRLARLPVGLVLAAVLMEAASLLSNTVMTASVLNQRSVRWHRLLALDLADLAATHTLPGGGATAAAVRFRLLAAEGVTYPRAIGASTIETVLSNVTLWVLFAIGAILTAGRVHTGAFLLVGITILISSILVGVAGWALLQQPEASRRIAGRIARRIPFLGRDRAEGFVGQLSISLRELGGDSSRAGRAGAGALGNWIFDAAALWLMVAACGDAVDPFVLLTAYGIGTILSQLPLTPGGVGIVESAITVALIGLGVDPSAALLGVLGWRVLEYLLPMPVGWLCFLYLRARAAPSRVA